MLGFRQSPFQLSIKSKHDASPKASTSALPEARDVTTHPTKQESRPEIQNVR